MTFYLIAGDKKMQRVADGLVEPDGTCTLSSYAPNDGAPAGEHAVTVVWRKPFVDMEGKPGPELVAGPLRQTRNLGPARPVKAGRNDFTLELKDEAPETNPKMKQGCRFPISPTRRLQVFLV